MALGTERNGHGEMEDGVGLDVGWKKKKGMRRTPRCVAQKTRPIDGSAVHGDEEKLAEDHVLCLALLGSKRNNNNNNKSHPSHEKVSGNRTQKKD